MISKLYEVDPLVAEKPPVHAFEQVALMAAEEGGGIRLEAPGGRGEACPLLDASLACPSENSPAGSLVGPIPRF
jgi:hypothetical protein